MDLDSDGENEIFAVVVGSYTSGSGGSSALWCAEQDGELVVKQAFTLVNMPVIVVDNEDGGAKDLILERSGGGAETEYVMLTCADGVYTNVSDAETVSSSDLQDVYKRQDKEDIVTISKQIDTYETSIQPFEDCCTIFVAKHPVTKPNINVIKRSELKLAEKIDELSLIHIF